MSILLTAGVFAIILGLFLMILGGTGHSKVSIRYYGLGIFGQAWFIVLLLGFLLIVLDLYYLPVT